MNCFSSISWNKTQDPSPVGLPMCFCVMAKKVSEEAFPCISCPKEISDRISYRNLILSDWCEMEHPYETLLRDLAPSFKHQQVPYQVTWQTSSGSHAEAVLGARWHLGCLCWHKQTKVWSNNHQAPGQPVLLQSCSILTNFCRFTSIKSMHYN